MTPLGLTSSLPFVTMPQTKPAQLGQTSPFQPISAHWGMADPAKATGTEAEINLAFQHAYGVLKNRLTAFVALPASELSAISLQREVDAIAVTSPTPQEAP
jgi:hypothetical protein